MVLFIYSIITVFELLSLLVGSVVVTVVGTVAANGCGSGFSSWLSYLVLVVTAIENSSCDGCLCCARCHWGCYYLIDIVQQQDGFVGLGVFTVLGLFHVGSIVVIAVLFQL